MGIKQLMILISDTTPGACRETELKNLFGRTVAMDASMALYSFMVAIRPDSQFTLQDESGEGKKRFSFFFFFFFFFFLALNFLFSHIAFERHVLPDDAHDEARSSSHLGV